MIKAKIAEVQDSIDMIEEEMGPKVEGEEVDKVKLEKSRRLYELTMRDRGETSAATIEKGVKYAALLYKFSAVKAARLASKLFENGKRIFGIDHHVTEEAEEVYQMATQCCASLLHPTLGMIKFNVLSWDMQKDCYVLKPPPEFADDEEHPAHDLYKEITDKAPGVFFMPRRVCILSEIVAVVVFGLPEGPLHHLNNKVGETKVFSISEDPSERSRSLVSSYEIQFEDDDLEDCEVPAECVVALTKLPPENATIKIEMPASNSNVDDVVDEAPEPAPASS